ncbi:MAG: nucleotidyl transferase AbiEii/AbiGii toxin family protein [Candidatus Magasanikbacteria bacterium]|jgi:hypothetical protein
MHKEILTAEQIKLLPLLKKFRRGFGLCGGTAIALHIGHRQSIDFDLFSAKKFDNHNLIKKISDQKQTIQKVFVDHDGEYTAVIGGAKFTFLHYPFNIKFSDEFGGYIKTPDLLTLAALKAYALGRRAKWKNYVDLYFIMRDYFALDKISKQATKIFGDLFNEKIFRTQLAYFQDIDYSEQVIWLPGFAVKDTDIKKSLLEWSVK